MKGFGRTQKNIFPLAKNIYWSIRKKEYRIKEWIEVIGDSDDDAYKKLMSEPLYGGEALKDILDEIEWLEG
ncbi:MAG: hypothetical protein IJQ67_07655 [Bacilli bacterium]|nr:hypothetical protein [Bacilli bacterium]